MMNFTKMNHTNVRQFLNFIPLTLLAFNCGVSFGWTSPMTYRLQADNFPLTMDDISWIASVTMYGVMFGPLFMYFLMDQIGRKKLIIGISCVCTIQWTVLSLYKSVPVMLVARFLFGVSFGIYKCIVPIYVAENCSCSMRGTIAGVLTFGASIGNLVSNAVLYVDYYSLHLSLAFVAFVTTLATFYLCESVEFLLLQDRLSEARRAYFWLRPLCSQQDENGFSNMVEKSLMHKTYKEDSLWALFRNKMVRKSLTVVVVVSSLSMVAGEGPIGSYFTLLVSTEVDQASVKMMSVIKELFYMCGALLGTFLIERYNRRIFFKTGYVITLISTLSCALLYSCDYYIVQIPGLSYYVWVMLTMFSFMLGAHAYPIMCCVKGEILPQHVKPLGVAFTVTLEYFLSATMTSIFWPVAQFASLALNFYIFSAGIVALICYAHARLPETRNKSLMEIEHEFLLQC